MSERITITVNDAGVADARLNRPDKLNALDLEMFVALAAAVDRLEAMPGLRAVVLSGEGRAFCAGLDIASVNEAGGVGDLLTRTHGDANLYQQAAWGWHSLKVPVIAAVHGVAFGGGFQIMLGADIRIIHPMAQLSVMEMRWGLVPDMAGMALLRHLVRDDVARELTYSARKFDGREAKTLGLATRLDVDPRAAALTLAGQIAANSPAAVRSAKRLLNQAGDADAAAILHAESVEQQAMLVSPGHVEAVTAHREARKPVYPDA